MGEEQMGLEISVEDLKALAGINPLAWAQLLHIADVRILKARIEELEEKNTSSDRLLLEPLTAVAVLLSLS